MALPPCVERILCGTLGPPARAALRLALSTLRTFYEVLLAELRVKLSVLNLALLPVEVARDAVNLVVEGARAPLALIDPLAEPLEVCAGLGGIISTYEFYIDDVEAKASDILDKARRLLSVRDEIEGLIADLESLIDLIDESVLILEACA